MADAKLCSRCGKTKPLNKFSKDASTKDGYQRWCKACHSKYARQHYDEHKEEKSEYGHQYRAGRKEEIVGYALQRTYGITLAEYDTMLIAQGGGCAICGRSPEENGRRLGVDHDHETGEVRGLLCGNCNQGIGFFKDDTGRLRSAANYLEKN